MSKRQPYGKVIARVRQRERNRNLRLLAEMRAELVRLDAQGSIALQCAMFWGKAFNRLFKR